jgi:3-hydroxyisobutyrate dehydrogenase
MKAAFIGLGAMGRPMATNLARAGCLQQVWNRSIEKTATFVATNKQVSIAATLAELARNNELIFTCVSADDDLREVIEVMKPALSTGSIIVDTSTVSADTSRELAAALAGMGVAFLDAPVSGGVEGAINGMLSMMVGGDRNALEKIRPLLQHLTSRVVYMGPSGSGQATKAVNQIMAAGINQAVCEALAFAEAMDLDMARVIDVVGAGAAGNWFLQHRGASMTQDRFDPGFKVALHHKDLGLCKAMIETLADSDKSLPIVEMTLIHYQRLMDEGFADEDISALYRLKRRLFSDD